MPLVETLPVHAEHLGSASGRPDTEAPSLSDEALPVACQRGLGLIAAELVDHLVRDGEAHFQQAQLAMAASEPTAAQGRQS